MKLCPICDSKVNGVWCSNCHHFIKPVDINTKMHLNESHDPAHDEDCEYHNDKSIPKRADVNKEVYDKIFGEGAYGRKSDSTHKSSTQTKAYTFSDTGTSAGNRASQSRYTKAGTSAKDTGSHGTPKVNKKKSGCGCGTLFIIWIIIVVLTQIVMPAVAFIGEYGIDNITEEIQYIFSQIESEWNGTSGSIEIDFDEYDVYMYKEDDELSGAKAFIALENIPEPIYMEDNGDEIYCQYAAEAVEQAGIGCDMEHADMTVEEYIRNISYIFGTTELERYKEDESDNRLTIYNNYDSCYAVFNTGYGFRVDNIKIDIEFDTATRKIHEIMIYMYEDEDIEETAELVRQCIEAAAPDYPYDKEQFVKAYRSCISDDYSECDKQYTDEYAVYMYAGEVSLAVFIYAQH